MIQDESYETVLQVEAWWVCPLCDNKNIAQIIDTPDELECPECEAMVNVKSI